MSFFILVIVTTKEKLFFVYTTIVNTMGTPNTKPTSQITIADASLEILDTYFNRTFTHTRVRASADSWKKLRYECLFFTAIYYKGNVRIEPGKVLHPGIQCIQELLGPQSDEKMTLESSSHLPTMAWS